MAITDWPEDEKPRERLLKHGAHSLSDAELLAIFLRVGVAGKSAVDLARDMLTQFGSLSELVAAPRDVFLNIHGLGTAKYAQLQASVELSRRALGEQLKQKPVFNQPSQLQNYVRLKIAHQPQEVFYVMLLASDLSLVFEAELFRGTLGQTAVYPREIVKLALQHNAHAVVVAHNHPSGSLQPSSADIAVTQHIRQALQTVDVKLLDHIIVSMHGSVAFHDLGLL